MGDNLIDAVELRVTSPKWPLPGIENAIKQLNALSEATRLVQQQLNSLKDPGIFRGSKADFRAKITEAERVGRFGKDPAGANRPAQLRPADLAKALGFDQRLFENFISQAMLGGATKASKQLK